MKEASRDKGIDYESIINMKVFCRLRPSLEKESPDTIEISSSNEDTKNILNQIFTFDKVFNEETSQTHFFEEASYILDDFIFNRKNGLIFNFGKNNSGKTYSMIGSPDNPGLIPFALKYIYQKVITPHQTYFLKCSFIEIFNEEVFDLLSSNTSNKQKIYLKLKNNGEYFLPNVTYKDINSLNELNHVLNLGISKKAILINQQNQSSSCSHVILKVIMLNPSTQQEFTLSMVDLAGGQYVLNSKTIYKSNFKGSKQNKNTVNSSVTNFNNCIHGLYVNSSGEKAVSYASLETKLTMLLKHYFLGKENILMIININPNFDNIQETLMTLKLALSMNKVSSRVNDNISKADNKSTNGMAKEISNRNDTIDININEIEKIKKDIDSINNKLDAQINNQNNHVFKIIGEFFLNLSQEITNFSTISSNTEPIFLKNKRFHLPNDSFLISKNNISTKYSIDNNSNLEYHVSDQLKSSRESNFQNMETQTNISCSRGKEIRILGDISEKTTVVNETFSIANNKNDYKDNKINKITPNKPQQLFSSEKIKKDSSKCSDDHIEKMKNIFVTPIKEPSVNKQVKTNEKNESIKQIEENQGKIKIKNLNIDNYNYNHINSNLIIEKELSGHYKKNEYQNKEDRKRGVSQEKIHENRYLSQSNDLLTIKQTSHYFEKPSKSQNKKGKPLNHDKSSNLYIKEKKVRKKGNLSEYKFLENEKEMTYSIKKE